MAKTHSTRRTAGSSPSKKSRAVGSAPSAVQIAVARKALEGVPWRAAPSRPILEERLNAQRQRIFEVMGICELASMAAASENSDPERLPESVEYALGLAYRALDAIAGEIEPDEILRLEQKEAQQ